MYTLKVVLPDGYIKYFENVTELKYQQHYLHLEEELEMSSSEIGEQAGSMILHRTGNMFFDQDFIKETAAYSGEDICRKIKDMKTEQDCEIGAMNQHYHYMYLDQCGFVCENNPSNKGTRVIHFEQQWDTGNGQDWCQIMTDYPVYVLNKNGKTIDIIK